MLLFIGLAVGALVGATGVGGASLLTPLLVLVFGFAPSTAIATDLVSGSVMKPLGSLVHARRGLVNWKVAGFYSIGSIPGATIGSFIFSHLPAGMGDEILRTAMGALLLVGVFSGLVQKQLALGRTSTRPAEIQRYLPKSARALLVTFGALVGFAVGATSIGAGSLVLVTLTFILPQAGIGTLVATDLIIATPLVWAAAAVHSVWGDPDWGAALWITMGASIGVLLGAAIAPHLAASLVKTVICGVIAFAGMKLLGASVLESSVAGACAVVLSELLSVIGRRRKFRAELGFRR